MSHVILPAHAAQVSNLAVQVHACCPSMQAGTACALMRDSCIWCLHACFGLYLHSKVADLSSMIACNAT